MIAKLFLVHYQAFMLKLGPIHSNTFSFENAYLLVRVCILSTLKRLKKAGENEDFRKRFQKWRLLKTPRFSVNG